MSFPLSPTTGQLAVFNGITYSYSTSTQKWTRVTQSVTATTSLFISGNTQSTGTTTGALVVTGGVGIGGNLYAGAIYSNGVLVGGNAGSATTSTNLNGGQAGYIPYQLAPSVTTLTNKLVFDGSYVQINSSTVLTTASVYGQVGITVSSTSTGNVYLAFIPGIQGVSADFGLISDPVGPIYYDWGTF
jgi:hypothetical protein